jgi:protein TonB
MLNSKFDLYKTEWLDLVFADRNKAYGAYDLRNHYGDNMMKALAITVLGFTVAAVSLTIAFKHDVVETPHPQPQIIYQVPIAPPKLEKPVEPVKRVEPPKGAAKPAITTPQVNTNTQRVLPPVITTDPVTTERAAIDPNKQISNVNNTADATKPITGILDGNTIPGNKTGGGADDGSTTDNTPHDINGFDEMPSPIGGQAAWSKFLQKNLQYPDTEQEGRVIISFVIEKDGRLTDIKILKGVVSELDREALRVLKLAPAWKPGQQNGKPVRVKYTIPVIFQMNQ